MLRARLLKFLKRWAVVIIALVLGFMVQPCRHGPGEACRRQLRDGPPVQAFGLYRMQPKHSPQDTSSSRLPSNNAPTSAYDSLPSHLWPLAADRLSE